MTPPPIHIVPHTHWDREWYLPFQRFRVRLVDLGDRLLDILEDEPGYAFTFDGQMAAVEDYLAMRPDEADRVRRFASEGRLALGPWLILLDEFLPSGECIVRNLQLGHARAEALGGAMRVGYLPDMFGHIAQMPQILRRAGLAHTALWRGVPGAIDTHAFAWSAPDGSTVRAEYLVGGYGNAAHLLSLPGALDRELEVFEDAVADYFDGDPRLAMFGTDHRFPHPDTMQELRGATAAGELNVTTLEGYLAATASAGDLSEPGPLAALPEWRGEMRSSARANVLMGVISTNVHVKAAAARAERRLARYAEPWQALHGDDRSARLLELAWHKVVECSAHDSVTACSRDEVAEQVRIRYGEAEQIAEGITERTLDGWAQGLGRDHFLVANPSPVARRGLVELETTVPEGWEGVALRLPDGRRLPCQQTHRPTAVLRETVASAAEATAVFDLMHGRELFGRFLDRVEFDETDDRPRMSLIVTATPDGDHLDVEAIRTDAEARVRRSADRRWTVRIVQPARRHLAARIPVDALGLTHATPVPQTGGPAPERPVTAAAGQLDNGLVRVDVRDDGLLDVHRNGVTLPGVGRIVDGGDAGDTYNYAPPATDDLVAVPEDVTVEPGADGPVVARTRVIRRYRWPAAVDHGADRRSATTTLVAVTTTVELRAGEPFVRLRVAFDNTARDHRVRLHVPLARRADFSHAEGQFAVVRRGLDGGEEGHGEVGLATYPARGFVAAGGAAALLRHVMEYEVVDGGRELALTLLRAVGMLSRNTNRFREEPAGPEVPVRHAQCPGPVETEVAVLPYAGAWHEADIGASAERFQHPLRTVQGRAPRDRQPPALLPAAGLTVDGEHHVTLTALRRREGWLEVRVVNEHPEPTAARIAGGVERARRADLLGRAGEPLQVGDGAVRLALDPWEIATVLLRR